MPEKVKTITVENLKELTDEEFKQYSKLATKEYYRQSILDVAEMALLQSTIPLILPAVPTPSYLVYQTAFPRLLSLAMACFS